MGNGTDLAILITLIVIAVLVAIIVIVSLRSRAEKQTGNYDSIEEKTEAFGVEDTKETDISGADETDVNVLTAQVETEEETDPVSAAGFEADEADADISVAGFEAYETDADISAAGSEADETDSDLLTAQAEAELKEDEAVPAIEDTSSDIKADISGLDDSFMDEDFSVSEIKPLDDVEAVEDIEEAGSAEIPEEDPASTTNPDVEITFGDIGAEKQNSFIKNYNTGRSGHSYSKEELEEQIRI